VIKSKLYKSIKIVRKQMLDATDEEKQLYTNDLIQTITVKRWLLKLPI
jgi:hypothetical protein